jgi:multidrug efflux pump subunit AcrB
MNSGKVVNISAWAIKRPLPALMLFFVLCVAGLWGFHKLPVSRFPDISFPMTTVSVMQPGASPSQLETEVTRKVEDQVATIPNVKRVMSSVTEGVSTTTIEFNLEADLATALDDTRDAITRIRTDLPQDIQEPVIGKVEIGGSLMTYAVSSPGMEPDELSWFVDREVSRALYGVKGVAAVSRVGGVDRQVRVDIDPQALQAFGITAAEVSSQLARIQVDAAGGRTEVSGAEQSVRTLGTIKSAQELENFSISLSDGRAVRLSNLAHVHDGIADPTQSALLDGKDVVGFSLSRTRGSDEIKVAEGVAAALEELKKAHPGTQFSLVVDMVEETRQSYGSSMTMLYEGALLALLVVFLFLRDWRATWVSALALPLSIIPLLQSCIS